MHHGVKFSYYHYLCKIGGKTFIPYVSWDVIFHTFSIYNRVEGDSFETHESQKLRHKLKKECDVMLM